MCCRWVPDPALPLSSGGCEQAGSLCPHAGACNWGCRHRLTACLPARPAPLAGLARAAGPCAGCARSCGARARRRRWAPAAAGFGAVRGGLALGLPGFALKLTGQAGRTCDSPCRPACFPMLPPGQEPGPLPPPSPSLRAGPRSHDTPSLSERMGRLLAAVAQAHGASAVTQLLYEVRSTMPAEDDEAPDWGDRVWEQVRPRPGPGCRVPPGVLAVL